MYHTISSIVYHVMDIFAPFDFFRCFCPAGKLRALSILLFFRYFSRFYHFRRRVEQSFIEVSNHLVRNQHVRVPANRLLILTPHCIQLDTCPYKVTRDITNCHQCGRCGVGQLLALSKKYGVHVAIATGGTLARQAVKKARPKAILAVACERDLTSGIQDVFPLPVIGVLNERPNGPCFNTRADMGKIEEAIRSFILEEDGQ